MELAERLLAKKPNDLHSLTAQKLGISRDEAKSFSYASIYGAQPKKLAKMLRISESKAKKLYEDYWNAVSALKDLKQKVEQVWERNNREAIQGLDGRLLKTRSKHSLINVLFQSGGAIAVKYAMILQCKKLEEQGLLGNPFVNSSQDAVAWLMIVMHDEAQYAVNPTLLKVNKFSTEQEANDYSSKTNASACSKKGSKFYNADDNAVVQCIEDSIKEATEFLKLRVDLGYEWKIGNNWEMCH